MAWLYEAILWIHVPIALSNAPAFWIAVFAHKGGRLHVGSGRWFARAMTFTAASGAVMATFRLLDPWLLTKRADAGAAEAAAAVANERGLAVFLLYLATLTAVPVIHGVRVVRSRRRVVALDTAGHRAICFLPSAGSLAAILTAVLAKPGSTGLLLAMSPLGFLVTFLALGDLRRVARELAAWRGAHMTAMLIGGIALHTALGIFFVGGLLGLNPRGLAAVALWAGPSIGFTVAITVLRVRDAKRRRVGTSPAPS